MAKYKGHDRVVFLDGYAHGRQDGLAVGWKRSGGGQAALEPAFKRGGRLRYTDALGVAYRAGGGRMSGPCASPVTGPNMKVSFEAIKRGVKKLGRIKTKHGVLRFVKHPLLDKARRGTK